MKGQLSKSDIKKECKKNNLKIIPFNEKCLKAASYDLTPTIIAMSAKIGMLEKVYREKRYLEDKYYIYAHPKDTVLIVSNEYIKVPPTIAGYVSSRVSKVVEGFGHISTTIDPNWSGAALIAISNPTNKILKIYVGTNTFSTDKPNNLATVTFHYLNKPCKISDTDKNYRVMRLDLLNQIAYNNRWGIRAALRWCFHRRQRKFTDYFFASSKKLDGDFSENGWIEFIKEFSYIEKNLSTEQENMSHEAQKRAKDFIISENWFIRTKYFWQCHKFGFNLVILLILYFAFRCGLIPEEFIQSLKELLSFLSSQQSPL